MKKLPRDYSFKYHLIGRIWTALAILLFLMIPVSIGLYYDVTPDWRVFGTSAVLIPLIINFVSGIVEPIIYAPMLGVSGEYLAFITGNLSNLKIPCVVKAQEICGTKPGSEENEVVSTLAIATSTLVTVVIIGVLVLCLAFTNLQAAVTRNNWILPAFSCVVYALFGSLGGKYVAKNPKLALIPAAIIVVLSVVLGVVGLGGGIGSAYLFVGIAVCGAFAAIRFALQKKKQRAESETERAQAILAGAGSSRTEDASSVSDTDETFEAPDSADKCESDAQNDAPSLETSQQSEDDFPSQPDESVPAKKSEASDCRADQTTNKEQN